MSREPERAPLIAVAAAGGWLLLCALELLNAVASRTLVARAARTGATLGLQSMLQLCLFFSLPFFARASAMPAHSSRVRGAARRRCRALTLWDATQRRAHQTSAWREAAPCCRPSRPLPASIVSCRWSVSSNRTGLFVAIVWTAFGLPLLALARRSSLLAPLIVATLADGRVRPRRGARFVPPAPLRFAGGEMGTRVVDRRSRRFDDVVGGAVRPAGVRERHRRAARSAAGSAACHVWRAETPAIRALRCRWKFAVAARKAFAPGRSSTTSRGEIGAAPSRPRAVSCSAASKSAFRGRSTRR